MSHGECMR